MVAYPLIVLVSLFCTNIDAASARKVGSFSMAKRKAPGNRDVLSFPPGKENHRKTTRLLAVVESSFDEAGLKGLGARLISRSGNIVSIEVSREQAPFVSEIEGVRRVEFPRELYPTMDSARSQTALDYVHGEKLSNLPRSYTGKGVLIGILDTEFDHQHEAFLDEFGSTRFIGIWDQRDTTRDERNPYRYGVIKMQEDLNKDPDFAVSANLHGTHMANSAAGSSVSTNFQGAAPGAMIAAVRYAGTTSELFDGLQWIFGLADSLNVPCVINMSIGVARGPHDGTSILDVAIDEISGPGRIIVGAVGNDGGSNGHVSFELGRGDAKAFWLTTRSYQLDPLDENSVRGYSGADIWGEQNKSFSVSCLVLDTSTMQYVQGNQTFSTSTTGSFVPDTIVRVGSGGEPDTAIIQMMVERSSNLNDKAHAQVYFFANNPDLFLGIRISTGNGPGQAQTVHAWHAYKRAIKSFDMAGFYDGDNAYTVNEVGGTAQRIITVGSWVSKREIRLWNGEPFMTFDNGEVGILPGFSGRGPTVDGRVKPDITAPGSTVMGAVSRGGQWSEEIGVWPDTTNRLNRYGAATGTSVSSPIVAGIIALMLEEDSTLSPEEVRTILQETATTDSYTGTISTPNNAWGAGKVNALRAMQKLQGITAARKSAQVKALAAVQALRVIRDDLLQVALRAGTDIQGYTVSFIDARGRVARRVRVEPEGFVRMQNKLPYGAYIAVVRNARTKVMYRQKIVFPQNSSL